MTEEQFLELRRKLAFARGLDEGEWRHLGPIREWKKGDISYPADELEQKALIVVSGCLRLSHIHDNGREWTVYRIREGGLFSLMASGIDRLSAETAPVLQAEEKTMALILTSERLLRWIGKYDGFGLYVFDQIQSLYAALSDKLNEKATRSVAVRLFEWLEAGEWSVHASQEELAVELATSREAVNRTLKGWEREGLIALSRKKIHVNDPQMLRLRIRQEEQ